MPTVTSPNATLIRMSPFPTPRELGYRMPAEWEPQAATWMTWPARENTSFPDGTHHDDVLPTFLAMIEALTETQQVYLNGEALADLEGLANLTLTGIPAVYPWCRDHGSTFVIRDTGAHRLAAVNWDYNAWGGKYPEILPSDFQINRRMAHLLEIPSFLPGLALEGGSIEVNGTGSLLVTTQCLLNPNRNPYLTKSEIESALRESLNVTNILWLDEGIVGDDTDGHIDDITRFVNQDTVVTVVESDPHDANYEPLRHNLRLLKSMRTEDGQPLNILELPMPSPVITEGVRLPASYANFYIGNKIVLQPIFGDAHDDKAMEIIGQCFPTRRIIPIDCRELVWGLGTFHCLTQQMPL